MNSNKTWTIALIAAAAVVGLGLSARPWRVFTEQNERTADYQKKMKSAEQRRVDLTKEKTRIDGPIGKEQAARDLGFTKAGEVPVR